MSQQALSYRLDGYMISQSLKASSDLSDTSFLSSKKNNNPKQAATDLKLILRMIKNRYIKKLMLY